MQVRDKSIFLRRRKIIKAMSDLYAKIYCVLKLLLLALRFECTSSYFINKHENIIYMYFSRLYLVRASVFVFIYSDYVILGVLTLI